MFVGDTRAILECRWFNLFMRMLSSTSFSVLPFRLICIDYNRPFVSLRLLKIRYFYSLSPPTSNKK